MYHIPDAKWLLTSVFGFRSYLLTIQPSDSLAEWSALRPSVRRVPGSIPDRVGDFNLDWLIPMPRGLGVCDVLSIRNHPR